MGKNTAMQISRPQSGTQVPVPPGIRWPGRLEVDPLEQRIRAD